MPQTRNQPCPQYQVDRVAFPVGALATYVNAMWVRNDVSDFVYVPANVFFHPTLMMIQSCVCDTFVAVGMACTP